MSRGERRHARWSYPMTWATLALALAFPIALMVFNPTLMFERGWEQYAGTAFYVAAVLTLARELWRMGADERAFAEAPAWLDDPSTIAEADGRVLPGRLRQLAAGRSGTIAQLMELNREGSGLDQEQAAGRFTLTRYILYLLPVIGFIGTVEGISKALMNISRVLPMVKDLDGFMGNLTSVTSALQIAFDSTLLALFLSAALMFVQTLVHRRSEDLLARVDRWVVEHVLPRLGRPEADDATSALAAQLEQLRDDMAAQAERSTRALDALAERLGAGLGAQVDRFAQAIDRLPPALSALQRGAEAVGRLGDDLDAVGEAGEALRKGVATLARIEATLDTGSGIDEPIEQIRRGVERSSIALEGLAGQWAAAFERSNRSTQDQLARTLGSLKEALDLLHVSMEQSNALYRNIVKSKFQVYRDETPGLAG